MAAWIVSIANSLDETREFLWENQPDVLVIDAELPGLETVKIVKTLCCYFPIGQIILTIATPETAPAFESQKNIFLFDKKNPAGRFIGADPIRWKLIFSLIYAN